MTAFACKRCCLSELWCKCKRIVTDTTIITCHLPCILPGLYVNCLCNPSPPSYWCIWGHRVGKWHAGFPGGLTPSASALRIKSWVSYSLCHWLVYFKRWRILRRPSCVTPGLRSVALISVDCMHYVWCVGFMESFHIRCESDHQHDLESVQWERNFSRVMLLLKTDIFLCWLHE